MTAYTGVSRAATREEPFALHIRGCADLERRERREHGGHFQQIEAASVAEALDQLIDSELVEMGYSHSDVRVFPCTK